MRLVRRLFAAAALAASAAGAASAADERSLFDNVQHYCIANGADSARVLAEADADGWGSPPEGALAALEKDMTGASGRFKKFGARTDLLLVGETNFPVTHPQVRAKICMVMGNPADLDDAARAASVWVGVGPNSALSGKGIDGYLYVDDPSGRRGILTDQNETEARRLFDTGKLRFLIVSKQSPLIFIGYMAPEP